MKCDITAKNGYINSIPPIAGQNFTINMGYY